MLKDIIGVKGEIPSWTKKRYVTKATKEKMRQKRIEKKKQQIEFPYTNDELRLNWKTLMHYRKDTWPEGTPLPFSPTEIEADKRDDIYIGMSEINGEKVYFNVSTDYIPLKKKLRFSIILFQQVTIQHRNRNSTRIETRVGRNC